MKYIIAYDLGTGGTKASLFNQNGISCDSAFVSYDTFFPDSDFREQRPEDWWNSIVLSTKEMMGKTSVDPTDIVSLAVSGHSLGAVPIGKDGSLMIKQVPIWSDARAGKETSRFFEKIDEKEWYLTTGNGFPAPLYAVFKIMWYKKNMPELYENTQSFIGTKDYINYILTGRLCTDHSYASGSGVYSLLENRYLDDYITAAGLDKNKFPTICLSTHIIGTISPDAAKILGLSSATKVVCGGVDNSCMAIGAGCIKEGDGYTSLGTSSWIAVSSHRPIVNTEKRPYVFAHCLPGQYVSATCIFSAGNSLRWVRNTLCQDLLLAEERGEGDSYIAMDNEAEKSPVGANKLIFNPSLAGGSSLDKSTNIRGGYIGLDLMHTRGDIIRSTLEGVCMNLRLAMNVLENNVPLSKDMLIVGGGGKSKLWRRLFASVYNKNIIETNIGQDAGSLGAAALAAVGCGLWSDFDVLKQIHKIISTVKPNESEVAQYEVFLPIFEKIADMQAEIGDMLAVIPKLVLPDKVDMAIREIK